MNTTLRRRAMLGMLVMLAALLVGAMPVLAAPDAQAATTTVTIVSTNDFHGALEGSVQSFSRPDKVGGADYVTGYINIVRQENPGGTLWLDAGDAMQGTLISNYFYGASVIDAFNAGGVDAMAIGNHEFDWGQEVLADREAQAEFPFLAANIFYAKENGNPNSGHGGRPHWAKPYVILEANGVKVGVIGIGNPETPSVANPILVNNLVFLDGAEAVNEVIPEVEAEGATMIVVLAHIGGFFPNFNEGIKDLACGVSSDKVDLIVSGHTHSRIDDVLCDIPVVQAYSGGTAFARVDFTVDTATGEAASYFMNFAPTTTYQTRFGSPAKYHGVTVVPDPAVQAIVMDYAAEVEAIKNTVVGETTAPITRNYRYESAMGDWITDIMRSYDPSIDFAFTNSGGLRADIDAGPITFGEIFAAQPFDNTLVLVQLSGTELRAFMEQGVSGLHGVIQVSGLSFTFNYDLPRGSRIIGDIIDDSTGMPINPTEEYTIAVNDFMANGGDDFTTLPGNPQTNTYVIVRDLVVSWTQANSPFTAPDPAVEQRITAFGTPPS